ncbi:sigma-70 family RNA polymerase sigma factor [Inquilinus limosus]|uniref:RNA polymerase sigma factor n=1 Tax=Inquilinus limosus TaxID=171674 RepID=UPI003F16E8A9
MISAATTRQFHMVVEPHLRAIRTYAGLLTRNAADADDLLQDTLLRACLKLHLWQPGTNMMGWLVVIMRRIFLSQYMQAGRAKPELVPLDDRDLGTQSSQDFVVELRELEARWPTLPKDHREVLERIAIRGESYEEVAARLRLPLGTLRSRVHRARNMLRAIHTPTKLGPADGHRGCH